MTEATYHPLSADSTSSINMQEFFLQGSIQDTAVDKLRERLQGLCDNVKPEPFRDHERTYVILNPSSVNSSIMVKATKSLLHSDAPWQLRYLGSTEIGDRSKNTMVRSNVTVAVSGDPAQFCDDLGLTLRFQIALNGLFYRRGRIKIIVAKLEMLPNMYEAAKLEAANSSHLVEISVLASSGDKTAGDEVRNFANLLSSIISLEKIDHRRLQQMP